MQGVPVRVEIGPRDLQKNQIVAVARDNQCKKTINLADADKILNTLLQTIQARMFQRFATLFVPLLLSQFVFVEPRMT